MTDLRRAQAAVLVAALAISLFAPAASFGDEARPRPATRVRIVDFAFSPRVVTITVGEGVRWRNLGPSPHTTTSDSGQWDSGILNAGESYGRAFEETGIFTYFCAVHPEMVARVRVTRAAESGSP